MAGRAVMQLLQRRKLRNKFPGPRPLWLLGNLLSFVKAGGFTDTLMRQLHDAYGPVVGFYLGPQFNVSVANADLISNVHRSCPSRPLETKMFLNYLGDDNLLFLHGPDVTAMRGQYMELVAGDERLNKVHAITTELFSAAAAQWAQTSSVNIHEVGASLVYEVPARVIFGRPIVGTPDGQAIYDLHRKIIRTVDKWMILDPLPPRVKTIAAGILGGFRRYRETVAALRARCGELLAARRVEMESNSAAWTNDDSALTQLLTATKSDGRPFFSDHQAVSTIIGLLNGAFDTSTATMTWLVYYLAKNQDIQQKLREEISAALDGRLTVDPGAADAAVLKKLPYLQAVMNESARLRPTVPTNQRVNLDRDVTIGEFVVPKGTNINIPASVAFRDSAYFGPDTDKFLPERFMGDGPAAKRARASITPFGGGPRVCVGLLFARYELKAAIAVLLLGYDFDLVDPQHPGSDHSEAGVTQPRPDQPILVRFRARR